MRSGGSAIIRLCDDMERFKESITGVGTADDILEGPGSCHRKRIPLYITGGDRIHSPLTNSDKHGLKKKKKTSISPARRRYTMPLPIYMPEREVIYLTDFDAAERELQLLLESNPTVLGVDREATPPAQGKLRGLSSVVQIADGSRALVIHLSAMDKGKLPLFLVDVRRLTTMPPVF
jgi:hypothetical protein